MPHRLADDVEEERRVLHVGITRGRAPGARPGRPHPARRRSSPSSTARAPRGQLRRGRRRPRRSPRRRAAPRCAPRCPAEVGSSSRCSAATRARSSAIDDTGVRLRLDDGGSFFVRFGERVTLDGTPLTLGPPAVAARRRGRRRAARVAARAQPKADGVPAFVVLSDKHLDGIAERHPTIARRAARLPRHRPGQARDLRRRDPRRARRPPAVAHRGGCGRNAPLAYGHG